MWNVSVAEQLKSFQGGGSPRFTPSDVAITSDGKLVAAGGRDGNIKVWEAESGRELFTMQGHRNGVRAITFSLRGDLLATSGQDTLIKLWSVTNGRELATLRGHAGGVIALAFSPDGKWLASGSQDQTIFLWNVSSRSAENSFVGNNSFVNAVAFSGDSRLLASGSDDGSILVWDVVSDKLLHKLGGHPDRVTSIAFSGNSNLLFSGSYDTSMKLWDVAQGKELASLFSLDKQDWLVITPDGLFDGSPAAWNQILWRFSASLFDVAPVELFFNEYYYPGLLADLFAGKRPVAPENLERKDRRQPAIRLSLTSSQTALVRSKTVGVKVEVASAPAGAQDVRLFRNGSLVKVWRGDVLKGQQRAVLEAQIAIVAGENRLTAYGFNGDNVKSADATLVVTGDESLKQAGTLYILAIAVNKYANGQFDLRYAVADATDFADELQRQEGQLKNFGRVEVIPLQDAQATKQNILRALTTLSTRAKPEDAVVVYFAGHGTAQQNQFYLIPHDLGYLGPRNGIDAGGLKSVLAHSISDRELERAFEGIDAGQFLLVIDACNSGQALEAEEKRRGPMNSKGLAQLAYEKGIYILTAAQSYQAALEPSELKHGLLTYALVEEGLKRQAADIEPKDGQVLVREWFSYVMKRVPQMQEQRMRAANEGGRQLVYVEGDEARTVEKRNVQRPRVFYRRELEDRPFTIARFGP
jgi:uncharacterized caspase-like protein